MPARLLFALLLASTLAPAALACPPCMMDPVTTFTNGVALPSTDPYRSHNVYWQGDPYRHGCCGGVYNYPCVRFAIHPNNCGSDPATYLPSEDCRCRDGSFESIESQGMVSLGQLPPPTVGQGLNSPGR